MPSVACPVDCIYSVGLFVLLILFSGQCEKPTNRDKLSRTPTFLHYAYSLCIIQPPDIGSVYGILSFTMKPIGSLIKEELERQERSISWFARKLSCDRSNVYRLFQKESIDTNLLTRISILLGRDFFSELSDNVKERL